MIDESKAAANRAAREAKKSEHLRGVMDRHTEKFRAMANAAPQAAAREAHAAIEAVLDRDRQRDAASRDIRCGKGCSHCCRGPVEIRAHEAVLLVEAARELGVEIDRARLERQSGSTVATWRQQPAADRACVFLGADGACTVYESRPGACRKLLVTSDPALCDADANASDRIERWFSWEAEIMESAALEVFGVELMPRLLLEALKDK